MWSADHGRSRSRGVSSPARPGALERAGPAGEDRGGRRHRVAAGRRRRSSCRSRSWRRGRLCSSSTRPSTGRSRAASSRWSAPCSGCCWPGRWATCGDRARWPSPCSCSAGLLVGAAALVPRREHRDRGDRPHRAHDGVQHAGPDAPGAALRHRDRHRRRSARQHGGLAADARLRRGPCHRRHRRRGRDGCCATWRPSCATARTTSRSPDGSIAPASSTTRSTRRGRCCGRRRRAGGSTRGGPRGRSSTTDVFEEVLRDNEQAVAETRSMARTLGNSIDSDGRVGASLSVDRWIGLLVGGG